jgi:hypothetical protein
MSERITRSPEEEAQADARFAAWKAARDARAARLAAGEATSPTRVAPPQTVLSTPWTPPEEICKAGVTDFFSQLDLGEVREWFEEPIGRREYQWSHRGDIHGARIVYSGGPGKCALIVAVTDGGPVILLRRNGRDGDQCAGFPKNSWYLKPLNFRAGVRRIIDGYVADVELRGAIERFLIGGNWEKSGMAGADTRAMLLAKLAEEEREDEEAEDVLDNSDRVSWDTEVIEEAFNPGQRLREPLDEEPERDDLEPDAFEWDEPL